MAVLMGSWIVSSWEHKPSEPFCSYLAFGSSSSWFNDLPSLPTSPKVASVTLRGAKRLDAVSFTLSTGAVLSHGCTGGDASSLTLASGEYFTSAKLCWGEYNSHTRNFYALLTTSSGRTVSAGTTTDDCATVTAPSGSGIVASYGQSGDEMDLLGWIYSAH